MGACCAKPQTADDFEVVEAAAPPKTPPKTPPAAVASPSPVKPVVATPERTPEWPTPPPPAEVPADVVTPASPEADEAAAVELATRLAEEEPAPYLERWNSHPTDETPGPPVIDVDDIDLAEPATPAPATPPPLEPSGKAAPVAASPLSIKVESFKDESAAPSPGTKAAAAEAADFLKALTPEHAAAVADPGSNASTPEVGMSLAMQLASQLAADKKNQAEAMRGGAFSRNSSKASLAHSGSGLSDRTLDRKESTGSVTGLYSRKGSYRDGVTADDLPKSPGKLARRSSNGRPPVSSLKGDMPTVENPKRIVGTWYAVEDGESLESQLSGPIKVYITSMRAVRKTFEQCVTVQNILKAYGCVIDVRDISMSTEFREELRAALGGSLAPVPRVFIGSKYLGGFEEFEKLNECEELKPMLQKGGHLMKRASTYQCETCGNHKFLPCNLCNGSRKIYDDDGEVYRCPDCNENGLVLCPECS